jgi:hypothetical protein
MIRQQLVSNQVCYHTTSTICCLPTQLLHTTTPSYLLSTNSAIAHYYSLLSAVC